MVTLYPKAAHLRLRPFLARRRPRRRCPRGRPRRRHWLRGGHLLLRGCDVRRDELAVERRLDLHLVLGEVEQRRKLPARRQLCTCGDKEEMFLAYITRERRESQRVVVLDMDMD